MAIKINPFNPGLIDFTGSGSGTQSPNYFDTFNNTTDWGVASGGEYTITVTAATHGKGLNPVVQVLELNGSDYDLIAISHKINASGDVSISVSETPDLRFNTKIIITENN